MTILCYHTVDPDWRSPLAVAPDAFEQHVAWLTRRRTVLPLVEALPRLDRTGRLPAGQAVLTFDDGFRGVRQYAFSSLRRQDLPATVFLVARTLTEGGQAVDWVDTPPERGEMRTLSLDEVLEMQDAGVSFQSHSLRHADLTGLTFDECLNDLRESKERLESLLGRPMDVLAYPRGRHDAAVRDAARRAGYTYALTLPEHRESPGPFAVPRVGVHRGNTVAQLRVKCARGYLPLRTGPVYGVVRRARRQRAVPTAAASS